jgi:lysophospholipase L1-like esterase
MRSFVICSGLAVVAVLACAKCGGDDTAPNANMQQTTSSGGSSGNGGSNGASGTNGSGGSSGSATGTGGASGSSAGNGGNAGTSAPNDSGVSDAPKESGSGDAASDAASAYNPCPAKGTPCSIMALGDSITDGVGGSGGSYRPALFKLALDHGQTITFVGNNMNGPNTVPGPDGGMVTFPKGNEGHSGFTIDDGGGRTGIHNLTAPAMMKFHPNIITLMIGTNDVDIMLDLPNAPMRLGGLLDTITSTDPSVLIVLAQIVPTTDDAENVRVKAYNDAMPALVKTRTDAGKHIVLVDMYGAFTANNMFKTEYMNDKLHPKDAGYAKMADVWYAAIGGLFR